MPTILYFDDQFSTRDLFSESWRVAGYNVLPSRNQKEFLEHLQTTPDIDLAILDVWCPAPDSIDAVDEIPLGLELAELWFNRKGPHAPMFFLSGIDPALLTGKHSDQFNSISQQTGYKGIVSKLGNTRDRMLQRIQAALYGDQGEKLS